MLYTLAWWLICALCFCISSESFFLLGFCFQTAIKGPLVLTWQLDSHLFCCFCEFCELCLTSWSVTQNLLLNLRCSLRYRLLYSYLYIFFSFCIYTSLFTSLLYSPIQHMVQGLTSVFVLREFGKFGCLLLVFYLLVNLAVQVTQGICFFWPV